MEPTWACKSAKIRTRALTFSPRTLPPPRLLTGIIAFPGEDGALGAKLPLRKPWLGYDGRMQWPAFNHIDLLRYSGLFTYLCVGLPLLQRNWVVERVAGLGQPGVALWAGCYVAFGLVYWWLSGNLASRHHRVAKLAGLVVMTAMAVAVGYFSQSGLSALLLVVAAVVLPWLLPLGWAVGWLVLQNLLLVPVFAAMLDSVLLAVFQALVYLGFSVLTFVTAVIARQQADAREEQRQLNSELRATRALLAESSRIAERMRIARELHDLMGHHLTALSLNLEVTSHLVDERAAKHVEIARSTAKKLLSDVREVVSELRQDDAVDLATALRALAAGVPGLKVHLRLPARFGVDEPRSAEVLLRCTQEIITNAVRHARARNLWIQLHREPDGLLRLVARDDGRGSDSPRPGNGLTGMRERLAEVGGNLAITSSPGKGFEVDAWIPDADAASSLGGNPERETIRDAQSGASVPMENPT